MLRGDGIASLVGIYALQASLAASQCLDPWMDADTEKDVHLPLAC